MGEMSCCYIFGPVRPTKSRLLGQPYVACSSCMTVQDSLLEMIYTCLVLSNPDNATKSALCERNKVCCFVEVDGNDLASNVRN